MSFRSLLSFHLFSVSPSSRFVLFSLFALLLCLCACARACVLVTCLLPSASFDWCFVFFLPHPRASGSHSSLCLYLCHLTELTSLSKVSVSLVSNSFIVPEHLIFSCTSPAYVQGPVGTHWCS